MTRKRKDANQKSLERYAHTIGGGWIDTTGDPSIGFDGIFLFHSAAFLIEVKDGAKAKSARQLTKNEAKRHAYVSQFGCVIHIVEGIEDLDRLARTVPTIRIAARTSQEALRGAVSNDRLASEVACVPVEK